ncbi:MAG: hypothetical protein ABI876_16600 [Bacteroidota bacterium]
MAASAPLRDALAAEPVRLTAEIIGVEIRPPVEDGSAGITTTARARGRSPGMLE